jgi:hypothetical protein
MTELAARILGVVERHPGVTSRDLAFKVGARKADVLAELQRLREGNHLRAEDGPRRSRAWYLPPSGSRPSSGASETGLRAESRPRGDRAGERT